MTKVSVLVPSGQEQFLVQTVNDLFTKASGEIEIIVALDGAWADPPLPDHAGLRIIHFGAPRGMRACLNAAAAVATGEWLMKLDAHCMVAEGYDEVLKRDCADNWVMVPRRWSLDPENWKIEENRKGPRDYHYLSNPDWSIRERDDYSMHGMEWRQRTKERLDKPEFEIDETPSWQGSCWFMSRKHWDRLGGLSEYGYGTFAQEPEQIGLQTWLGPWDGRLKVNKRTWYAHLHKGKRYAHLWRQYAVTRKEIAIGHEWSARYWMTNQWPERVHDIEWFVEEKFPNMPTWDPNWREMRDQSERDYLETGVYKRPRAEHA